MKFFVSLYRIKIKAMESIKKYVVYYRVSTKRQGESGLGLEAQKSYINMFLNDNDIITTFTEVKSAKNVNNRPELNKALDYCKKYNCGLAIAKVDRLSRNTEQALKVYNDLNGFIFSCDIPMQKFAKMDKFNLTLYLAFAERERFLISERTKSGLAKSKKLKGYNNPTIKKAVDKQAKKHSQEIGNFQRQAANDNTNNEKAFDKIKELRKENLSFQNIADYLNRRKNSKNQLVYETPNYKKGRLWSAIQVQRIYKKYTA